MTGPGCRPAACPPARHPARPGNPRTPGNEPAPARVRLRRGVHPDPLQAVRRPHRLVRITERQFPDQALVPGPRRPLVQRSDRPPPRRHRHRLLRIAVQPCPLERSQIRGIALPDPLTPAGLLKEPAKHRDVPGIGTDTAGRTHPPSVQLTEKAVQLDVIRTVRPQHEHLTLTNPGAGQHRSGHRPRIKARRRLRTNRLGHPKHRRHPRCHPGSTHPRDPSRPPV